MESSILVVKNLQKLENRTKKEDQRLHGNIENLNKYRAQPKINIKIEEIKREEALIRDQNRHKEFKQSDAVSSFIPLQQKEPFIITCGSMKIELISILSQARAGISDTILFLGKNGTEPVIVKIAEKKTLKKENQKYDELSKLDTKSIPKKLFLCQFEQFKKLEIIDYIETYYKPILEKLRNSKDLQALVIEQAKGEPLAVMYGDIHVKENNMLERYEFDMSVWIQIANVISVLQTYQIYHGDLHFNNIMVETLDIAKKMDFKVDGQDFFTRFFVRVIDFDMSDYNVGNEDWIRFLDQYNKFENFYSMPYIEIVDDHWTRMKEWIRYNEPQNYLMTAKDFLKSVFQFFCNNNRITFFLK